MQFAYPHMLWFLLVLPPALIAFFWWSWRKRQFLMSQFIQARLLSNLTVGLSARRQRIRATAIVGAVACLILTLARPQWGFSWEEARLRGLDIVVAIDTSKSMLAEDIAPNRLTRAKMAALDLVQQARSDRLGLVAFAGSAFLQCPLTIDDAAFRQSLDSLDVTTIPEGGTAIAECIRSALTAFKEGENHKVLVIFTDGEDHDSGALEAAKKAVEQGCKIFTIGIGSTDGEILRYKDLKGRTDYIRDPEGNVVKSRLNEDLLREISGATEGGFYLPLRGAKTVETLYQEGLAKLPKSEREEKLMKRYHERYHWPLALAILLLVGEFLFPDRKRGPRVSRASEAGKEVNVMKAPVSAALLVVALVLSSAPVLASDSGALRDYKRGQYDKALQEYQNSLQRKSDDPRLQFNTGAAAYRAQKFDEALKRFSEALNSPDLNLQQSAYYNRGNTLYYAGEQLPDPSKRSELWKKSVKDFESALKLNPQDTDAKFNQEVVKKRLQELQQQQQQQQKNDQKDKDDKEDQQQQQGQNEQQKDQKKEEQSGQQEQEKQEQQSAQDQQQQQQQQKQQGQQDSKPQPQEGQPEQQPGEQPTGSENQPAEQSDQNSTAAPGQMTPQQARQLLDAQKQDEKALPVSPANNKEGAPRNRPVKDW